MYTPTQSSFGTFGRNEDKGEMTNGMFSGHSTIFKF